MNNIRYYPVILYSIILVGVWLLSWLVGIYEIAVNDVGAVDSLISAEGIRWALRTVLQSVTSAPWAVAMLVVLSFSLIYGSGLLLSFKDLFCLHKLSANKKRALIMGTITLAICLVVLGLGISSPMRLLLGVTADLQSSPLVKGWCLLLLLISTLVSVVYGTVYGAYRSYYDVMQSICNGVTIFIPAFIAFVPASGILPCLEYAGFLDSTDSLFFYELFIYSLPFVCVITNK